MIRAADAAASIDEGVEHQVEELVGDLEADALGAGSGFAESWSKAPVGLVPVSPNSGTQLAGSRPPLLKKSSIALPTLS